MKKIIFISGHPNENSFCFGLAEANWKAALGTSAEVKKIIIRDLHFNPNLQFGYQQRTELEPDLLTAWEKMKWAPIIWFGYTRYVGADCLP